MTSQALTHDDTIGTLSSAPGTAFRLRRAVGAACLPAALALMLAGTALLDPLDDSADETHVLRQASGHVGLIQALGWAEVLSALLSLAGLLTVVGAVRRRGAGWANATGVLAGLGMVGMVAIAMNHFVIAGLVDADLTADQRVAALTHFHSAGGPVVVFIMLGALAFVLAAVTAWRAGLSSPMVLVPTAAFLVVSFAPGELAEYIALAAGLVAMIWVARDVLRAGWTTD